MHRVWTRIESNASSEKRTDGSRRGPSRDSTRPTSRSYRRRNRRRSRKERQAFLLVADQVPEGGHPSETQVQAALPAFQKIVEILRPDKYADLDALVIGKRIEQSLAGRLPEWVRELVFETGNDVQDEPAPLDLGRDG